MQLDMGEMLKVFEEATVKRNYSIIVEKISYAQRLSLIVALFSREKIPAEISTVLRVAGVGENLFSRDELMQIIDSDIEIPGVDDKHDAENIAFELKARAFGLLSVEDQLIALKTLTKNRLYKKYPSELEHVIGRRFYSEATDEQILEALSIIKGKVEDYYYCHIASHIKSDVIKEDMVKKMLNRINIFGSGDISVNEIIKSFSDDKIKMRYLDDKSFIRRFHLGKIGGIVASLSRDELKIKYIDKYFDRKKIKRYGGYIISDVISSLESDEKRQEYLDRYSDYLKPHELVDVLRSFRDDFVRIDAIEMHLSKLLQEGGYNFSRALFDMDDLMRTINGKKISKEFLKAIFINAMDIFPGFDEAMVTMRKETADRMMELYDLLGKETPSISDLKTLIAKQAKANFMQMRQDHPDIYFDDSLAETINPLITQIDIETILKDKSNQELVTYFYRIFETLCHECDPVKIADTFRLIGPKKDLKRIFKKNPEESEKMRKFYGEILGIEDLSEKDCKIILLLKSLNITEHNKDLFKLYFNSINSYCEKNNIDILELTSLTTKKDELDEETIKEAERIELEEKAIKFKKMFDTVTLEVLKESFRFRNKSQGGLLTQVCAQCLNIQQRIGVEEERLRLTSEIAKELGFTEKAVDFVKTERMKSIIRGHSKELKQVFDSDIKFHPKMIKVFQELYPGYLDGKLKAKLNGRNLESLTFEEISKLVGSKELNEILSFKSLEKLMISDKRYIQELTRPITLEEKLSIPFDYLCVDSDLQRQRVMIQLAKIVETFSINRDGDYSMDRAKMCMDQMKKGIVRRQSQGKIKGFELLAFDELSGLNLTTMGNFIKYYEEMYDKGEQPKQDDKDIELNPDNVEKFINKIKMISLGSSNYVRVLGEKVIKELDPVMVEDNYYHYVESVSGRVYRTIPSVSGKVESNDEVTTYRTYEVDDPEQIIAGTRIKSIQSCFRIGGAQEKTLKYITSSPNGTMIAFEDEHGNFMGRIYGYRVGNAVHFTRIYCDRPFDYEKVMSKVGQDIIDSSEEIDYVTVIPDTSQSKKAEDRYTQKNIMLNPIGINVTQENEIITTDHTLVSPEVGISVIASRKPIEDIKDVKFSIGSATEVFYKKRSGKVSLQDNADKARAICLRSDDPNFEQYLGESEGIIVGDDWAIVYIKDEEPKVIKVKFEEGIHGEEYGKKVDKEIEETLKKVEEQRKGIIVEGEENAKSR